ncbi:prepilin-type N-terminal cleavage/methylation domain-containing protein [Patescibacteria group bacterium]|nr:prepilin-type N-terminal cleavage/methylation domain-containing protein [Patescibacteria group bacterium]MBU1563925.1 prepilin-type N-terminal cleavage/methylation domain-containing protein [Patescibacteria group bacterium]MBU2068605.1 prepilin-type N-terminal cleavage/methylation domain-containing protein [Patescibacteria group bacterium]
MEILKKKSGAGFTLTPKNFGVTLRSKGGFTLVELLIAMFAFGMIIIAISGVSQSVIKAQRKAFALQEVQESGRYLLEAISKEVRMSTINTPEITSTDTLNITNSKDETVIYNFDGVNGKIKKQIDGGIWENISPTNLDLTGSFYIRKSSAPTPKALVTINMKIESPGLRVEQTANIYLQSSISSRNWDY